MPIDEVMLIEKCRQGNLKAFTEIYSHYIGKIYDFIYYKTCHRETAEDITSQTFMKALEGIRNFDTGKGSLSSWLYKIAMNSIIDFYRKKRDTVSIDDIWDLASGENIERDHINRDHMEKISSYLNSLPHEKRTIIILRVWQELPYSEIAEIMNRTEAQCKMIFYRAIDKMKKQVPASLFLLFWAGL